MERVLSDSERELLSLALRDWRQVAERLGPKVEGMTLTQSQWQSGMDCMRFLSEDMINPAIDVVMRPKSKS